MQSKKILRRKELAATISLLLAASPMALAQDQTDDDDQQATEEESADLGTVYVTGIRSGLQTAIDVKRDETSIVEAVSAEEIGKLPDLSITDSLARLPGVTAQRLNGRSQVISIRGLGPDFTTALLNGRQQVSLSDNRAVEFDAYPSELIQTAVVYKTPDAGLMGQGLAGTVDLRTVRPLEFGQRNFAANARYEWNDISALNSDSDDDGYRASFSYVDQFLDDTLGVAFGIATIDSPTQSERFNAWGYPDDRLGAVTGDPDAPTARLIGGAKPFAQSNNLERTGIMGALEWAPTDTFRTILDVYYTDFEETQRLRGIEIPMAWGFGTVPETLRPDYTLEDGLVTAGTWDGITGVIRNDLNARDAELWSYGANFEWTLTDNWTVVADLAYSEVDRTDTLIESYSGFGNEYSGPTDTMGFVTGARGTVFSPTLDYTSPDIVLTSPRGWGDQTVIPGGQVGYLNRPVITDELTWIDLRGIYTFDQGFFSSIEFGVNWTDREKTKVADEFLLGLAGGALEAPLPSNTGITNLGFLGIGNMVSYDPLQLVNDGTYTFGRNVSDDVLIKSWTVEEEVMIPFIQANFDTMAGDIPVYGNFGVQYVDTEQSSVAIAANEGGGLGNVINEDGDSYEEWLPSLNVTFQFPQDNYLRFAYARTLSRSRMDDLRASLEWSYNPDLEDSTDINNSPWGGSGGNPRLRPWIADAFDISWEKYLLDGLSYVAVAAFYKDLDTWVLNQDVPFDFTGYPSGDSDPILNVGLVNVPTNGVGGDISGFELSGAINLGAFTDDWWGGFGAVASASFTDSNIENEPGNEITVPGLSEDVYNLTLYFENERWSTRVNMRHRSDFIGEVSGFGNGREFRTVQEETIVDAQVSYFFGGNLTGLNILLQGLNLTDEEFVTITNNDVRQVIDYQRYGRTYLLGLAYIWQ